VKSDSELLTWNLILKEKPFLVFGILNITPDSFSDGGIYTESQLIRKQFLKLIDDGADAIDVGAESTRAGAIEVVSKNEIVRLTPFLNLLNSEDHKKTLLSIDTRHSDTARIAIKNGFQIINDVSCATFDTKMSEVMAESKSLVIIMHSRGTPQTMNTLANYEDVVSEVTYELSNHCERLMQEGVDRGRIMVDPGIGFAKTPEQGIQLIESISKIKTDLGFPMMVGVSRKTITSFMLSGDPQNVPFDQRDNISAEIAMKLKLEGIDAVRVHNVAKTIETLLTVE